MSTPAWTALQVSCNAAAVMSAHGGARVSQLAMQLLAGARRWPAIPGINRKPGTVAPSRLTWILCGSLEIDFKADLCAQSHRISSSRSRSHSQFEGVMGFLGWVGCSPSP